MRFDIKIKGLEPDEKKPSHALLRLDFSIKDEELSEADDDDDDFSIGRCEKFENYDLGVFAETPEIKMSDEKLVRLVFDRFVGATQKVRMESVLKFLEVSHNHNL